MAETHDVAILGSGPGGYVCAIRCAQLGLKTVIVEREHFGGICLNWGCIPTKALLRASEIWRLMHRLDEFGFAADNLRFDLGKIVARSRKVAGQLSGGVRFLMKKHKVAVIEGEGRLSAPGRLAVTGKDGATQEVAAKNIVVATGARARQIPGLEADGKLVWTYKEAMVPQAMPKSLLVIGSGAIGMEFASFYRALGAAVTVVELVDRILPAEDEEIAALAHKAFVKQGMDIRTGASVTELKRSAGNVTAGLKEKDGTTAELTVDRVIKAVGITGNVENIGLEQAGVRTERGHIAIDRYGATGVPGVWAIGDVVGPPWLAHKASHEGVIVAERIAGRSETHPLDTSKVPGCTYCAPQIASVGMTEAKARAAGREIRVGRFPFVGNGKAIALGEPEGLIKTVFDARTGELLGAHMIGAEVTELIHGYTLARSAELTEAELIETIFPHPTLSETLHEAVLDAFGRVMHV